jgi:hypothetical protein
MNVITTNKSNGYYIPYLEGNAGMTLLSLESGSNDDGYYLLPNGLDFVFPFYDIEYSSDIYVGTNSYITFGYGSTSLSASCNSPGRGIFFNTKDNSCDNLYFLKEKNRLRIRFEGYNATSGTPPYTFVWECSLWRNGNITLVTGDIENLEASFTGMTDDLGNCQQFSISPNKTFVFIKNGSFYNVITK